VNVAIADSRAEVLSAMRVHLAEDPELRVVGEAHDVPTLLATLRVHHPDVVLVDWDLGGSDVSPAEDDLLAQIALASPGTRVIALSARIDAKAEALEAGADAFVSKCAPADRLIVALRSLD
jgi:DNA-binding NarL/FixJ family response regulator